jgi:hypothetical protein
VTRYVAQAVVGAAIISYMVGWVIQMWQDRPAVVQTIEGGWTSARSAIPATQKYVRALPPAPEPPPTLQGDVMPAGRPLKYNDARVQMQVRLPPKLRNRLQKEAARRAVSKTLLVERAIQESLDRWEQEERLVASKR